MEGTGKNSSLVITKSFALSVITQTFDGECESVEAWVCVVSSATAKTRRQRSTIFPLFRETFRTRRKFKRLASYYYSALCALSHHLFWVRIIVRGFYIA